MAEFLYQSLVEIQTSEILRKLGMALYKSRREPEEKRVWDPLEQQIKYLVKQLQDREEYYRDKPFAFHGYTVALSYFEIAVITKNISQNPKVAIAMYEEIHIEELVKFQPKELMEHTISDANYTDHACSFRDGLCRQ